MTKLSQQKCLNHPSREAIARCPSCGHFFCRECITEHDGIMSCSNCLSSAVHEPKVKQKNRFYPLIKSIFILLLGLFTAWFFFFQLGQVLLAIPDSFHSGNTMESAWKDVIE